MHIRPHILKFDPDICWLHRFFVLFSQFDERSFIFFVDVCDHYWRTMSVCGATEDCSYNATYTYDRFFSQHIALRSIFGLHCFGWNAIREMCSYFVTHGVSAFATKQQQLVMRNEKVAKAIYLYETAKTTEIIKVSYFQWLHVQEKAKRANYQMHLFLFCAHRLRAKREPKWGADGGKMPKLNLTEKETQNRKILNILLIF